MDVRRCPIRKEGVEQPLVSAVERSFFGSVFHQVLEGFVRRLEHKNARIEAVRPSSIWSSGKLFPVKQFVAVLHDLEQRMRSDGSQQWSLLLTHHSVCVQENALGILDQLPAMQLGERHSQFWALEEFQIGSVSAVQSVDVDHVIEGLV